jgi:hypothetical protein
MYAFLPLAFLLSLFTILDIVYNKHIPLASILILLIPTYPLFFPSLFQKLYFIFSIPFPIILILFLPFLATFFLKIQPFDRLLLLLVWLFHPYTFPLFLLLLLAVQFILFFIFAKEKQEIPFIPILTAAYFIFLLLV